MKLYTLEVRTNHYAPLYGDRDMRLTPDKNLAVAYPEKLKSSFTEANVRHFITSCRIAVKNEAFQNIYATDRTDPLTVELVFTEVSPEDYSIEIPWRGCTLYVPTSYREPRINELQRELDELERELSDIRDELREKENEESDKEDEIRAKKKEIENLEATK